MYVETERLVAQVLNFSRQACLENLAPEQQAVASLRTPNEWIWSSLYRHPNIELLNYNDNDNYRLLRVPRFRYSS